MAETEPNLGPWRQPNHTRSKTATRCANASASMPTDLSPLLGPLKTGVFLFVTGLSWRRSGALAPLMRRHLRVMCLHRCLIFQGQTGSFGVAMDTPGFDDLAARAQGPEPMLVQTLVSKAAIEIPEKSAFCRLSRLDKT